VLKRTYDEQRLFIDNSAICSVSHVDILEVPWITELIASAAIADQILRQSSLVVGRLFLSVVVLRNGSLRLPLNLICQLIFKCSGVFSFPLLARFFFF